MARYRIIKEVKTDWGQDKWNLCFQWGQYLYDDRPPEYGFRFIWRRDNGTLQAARGQARIPSIELLESLVQKAKDEGWGKNTDEDPVHK